MTSYANWTSSTGERCSFHICAFDDTWTDRSGIYMMCALQGRLWVPKYIGQAASFKKRMCNHDQWGPAQRLGASHVLATVVSTQAERDRLEGILIRELQPPLNVQLRRATELSAGLRQRNNLMAVLAGSTMFKP